MASLDCASVADAMNCLIDLDDQFFAWTALVAPSEQLRSLIARRLTAPTAPELKGVLRRLRASIGRAECLVRLLRELTDPKGSRGPLLVAALLEDIVEVMRPVIEPCADISVEATPECVTTASRTTLVVVVGALLANALDGIRAASRGKGRISLHVFEAEEAIVVEVRDDGREIPSDLRPDLIEQRYGESTQRRGLPGLRDRVRRAGGDLLVDSGPSGNAIRVFLPSGRAPDAAILAQEAAEPVPPSTRRTGN
jgi:signal transduction histidine kinase